MAQLPKGLKLQRIGEETQGRGGGEGTEQQGHAPVAAHRAQGEHRHPAESIADDAADIDGTPRELAQAGDNNTYSRLFAN